MPAAHKPNKNTQSAVFKLSAAGRTQEAIADILDISIPTLLKYYRKELDRATDILVGDVNEVLVQSALAGQGWAVCFFLKTRGKYTERHDHVEELPPIGDLNIIDLTEDYVDSLEDDSDDE